MPEERVFDEGQRIPRPPFYGVDGNAEDIRSFDDHIGSGFDGRGGMVRGRAIGGVSGLHSEVGGAGFEGFAFEGPIGGLAERRRQNSMNREKDERAGSIRTMKASHPRRS